MSIFRWALFFALCVAAIIWFVVGSPSFEACINQSQAPDTQDGLEKIISSLLLYRRCVGPFLYANETTITSLSTLIIAIFTAYLEFSR
jgi:hypothetical protein